MSRRGGRNRNRNNKPNRGCLPNNYVQSIDLNERLYSYYRNIITQMAISRFEWINLPKTCDARYLELQLMLNGMATIAFPKKMEGTFMSLQVCGNGAPNMYDIPSKWQALGQNGTKFNCDNTNGVIVYDNATRYPLMNGIDLYAHELAQIRLVKRTNRFHQQMPFILKGDQRKRQDMVNLFRNVADGEPAILATDGISEIDYEVLSTGVDYKEHEIAEDELFVWNQVFFMLGSPNLPFKAERQTEDEISAQERPATLVSLNSLSERRKAANKLNERFGQHLDAPIEVVWAQDNISKNYNLLHDIKALAELGDA